MSLRLCVSALLSSSLLFPSNSLSARDSGVTRRLNFLLTNGKQCAIFMSEMEENRMLDRALDKKNHSSMPSRRESTGKHRENRPFSGLKSSLDAALPQRLALKKSAQYGHKMHVFDAFRPPSLSERTNTDDTNKHDSKHPHHPVIPSNQSTKPSCPTRPANAATPNENA